MINASKTPIPSDDVWWQRVHTESGLSNVLKLCQFKELFQFISDEAVDRSIMTLIQTDETERFERVLSLEGLRHILECTSNDAARERALVYADDEQTEHYTRSCNALNVRGMSIDFMRALYKRSVFRSKVPFVAICVELCRALPVDERWNSASTEDYQALDRQGSSTDTFRELYDAGLFDRELSFPALCAEIEDVRAEISLS